MFFLNFLLMEGSSAYAGEVTVYSDGTVLPHGRGKCDYGEGREYDGEWARGLSQRVENSSVSVGRQVCAWHVAW